MSMNIGAILDNVQKKYLIREKNFKVGSIVKIYFKIIEGKRERIQIFQGTVIDMHGSGNQEMVKVRKLVGEIGVERTFALHSPNIQKIEFIKQGRIRRAKLFYLRDRVGKKAQLKNSRALKDSKKGKVEA
jgi:large subunit ribosomal protein L19